MIAFGGAAGLHAVAVADELGIRRVVFPESASTLSAYGILHSNLAHDLVRSQVLRGHAAKACRRSPRWPRSLLAEAQARLDGDAVPAADRQIELAADMRYKGQAFELTVPASRHASRRCRTRRLVAGFHAIHRQRFSYANPGAPVEIVSLRVAADRPPAEAEGKAVTGAAGRAQAGSRHRKVWMDGGWRELAGLGPRAGSRATPRSPGRP